MYLFQKHKQVNTQNVLFRKKNNTKKQQLKTNNNKLK